MTPLWFAPGAVGGPSAAIRDVVEVCAVGIELLAVSVVLLGTVRGTIRSAGRRPPKDGDRYRQFRVGVAKSLVLALELLVAADIVRTVILDESMENLLALLLLVVVRTFLGWSLVVEIEGRWPWSPKPAEERLPEV